MYGNLINLNLSFVVGGEDNFSFTSLLNAKNNDDDLKYESKHDSSSNAGEGPKYLFFKRINIISKYLNTKIVYILYYSFSFHFYTKL